MTEYLDISVIFSTYNRRGYLHQTLGAMCAVDREGLNVEFVVVDNNSADDTAQVIDSFVGRLPLRHLFEERPGKNCALNHALDTVELGNIVVFTDDDVVPRKDWLQQVAAACECWPEYDVFGGKIELIWPDEVEIPKWASESTFIRETGFGEHDLGTKAVPYQRGCHPSGANFWVRRKVLSEGARYDESMGPRPGQFFRMGSEAELLLRLAAGGRLLLYVPGVTVGHHVQVSLLDPRKVLKRAIRSGRGSPHLHGIPDPVQLANHPWFWRLRRAGAIVWYRIRVLMAQLRRDKNARVVNAANALRFYAYHREALAMSHKRRVRKEAGAKNEDSAVGNVFDEVICQSSGRGKVSE